MNEKKSYKVQIFEEHYVLLSDEADLLVLKSAEIVDLMMKEVSQQSAIADIKKIAILSALRIAGKLLHCEKKLHDEQQKAMAIDNYINQELSLLNL